ncbi:MAG: 16S rRNA (uracil(1498)-N(3))-methyltransferase [Desulfovibrio sp.]|nr:16S rRNA (uracil(1498)-N(3))-methyltransferase [Desulfovibrio sp.]
MSLSAFYLPGRDWKRECALTGEEARHFQALRIRKDEKILILDGRGNTGVCRVLETGRREIRLEILETKTTPEPASRPIIAIALSKAARRGFFLEKAAELGAWEVWLWQARRSQGHIDEKLRQACEGQLRAGAKQCRNPWFPRLVPAGNAEKLAALAQSCPRRILPWEEKAGEAAISLAQLGNPGNTVYAIGPEGGLAEDEVSALTGAGFELVSLGERVLRCETAATLCLGLHWWASQLKETAR